MNNIACKFNIWFEILIIISRLQCPSWGHNTHRHVTVTTPRGSRRSPWESVICPNPPHGSECWGCRSLRRAVSWRSPRPRSGRSLATTRSGGAEWRDPRGGWQSPSRRRGSPSKGSATSSTPWPRRTWTSHPLVAASAPPSPTFSAASTTSCSRSPGTVPPPGDPALAWPEKERTSFGIF